MTDARHDTIAKGQTYSSPFFGTVKITRVEERAIYFKTDTCAIESLSVATFIHLFL